MEHSADKYFVFCEYRSYYPHRAVFINIDKITDDKIKNQIAEIKKLCPEKKILCRYEKILINNGNHGYRVNGYDIGGKSNPGLQPGFGLAASGKSNPGLPVPLEQSTERDTLWQEDSSSSAEEVLLLPVPKEQSTERDTLWQPAFGLAASGKTDTSRETQDLIRFWNNLIEDIGSDYDGDKFTDDFNLNSFYYYINDKNRYLSPNDLYEKILSMAHFESRHIKVDDCIMLSEVPFDTPTKIMLRYFVLSKEAPDMNMVVEKMMQQPEIVSVIPSKKSEEKLDIWGYVEVADVEYVDKLLENGYDLDDKVCVVFDLS